MKRRTKLYLVWGTAALVFLLVVALAATARRLDTSPIGRDTELYIDRDDTPDSVYARMSETLQGARLWLFRQMGEYTDYASHISTGYYRLPARLSPVEAFRILRAGRQTPVRITISPVRSDTLLAERLAAGLMASEEELLAVLEDSALLAGYGFRPEELFCLIVADTYEVYWDVEANALLRRLVREHNAYWTAERDSLAAEAGLTRREVVTLASIVERETANAGEKPTIAGLYLNRLHRGIKLQADPTVIFATGDYSIRRVLGSHLATESPYNTYLHEGLPPGPIWLPSRESIEAVLHYEKHNYLFMCAKEDFSGMHNFAATFAQHKQNARRFQAALNRRGVTK